MNTSNKLNTSMKSIRVLLADDHTLVRTGIRAILDKLPGVEVAGEASDGREVISLIKAHRSDVVLMAWNPHSAQEADSGSICLIRPRPKIEPSRRMQHD